MKKCSYMAFAMIAAMTFSACAGSKRAVQAQPAQPVQEQQQSLRDLDNEIARLKKQAELEALEHQLKMDLKKRQAEERRLEMQEQALEKMEKGTEVLLVFCLDEAIDKPGEYMAGLGISSNQLDQKDALLSANQTAISDIATRFMGVIKNGVEAYNKETNTTQRSRAKESQLEGLAMSVGEKAINKHANVVCRKLVSEKTGTYGAYVAVHVPLKETVEEIAEQLDVLQVDVDKSRFYDKMSAELKAEQEKRKAEQEQLRQNMLP